MKYIIVLFLIVSCGTNKIVGPNYNQGRTHNEEKYNRERVVYKEDKRSKKQMKHTRNKASRTIKRQRTKKFKNNRKLIR